jgi:hypothetical protein
MAQDVFKILKDLELKAVGLNPQTNQMQEGYFASFRPIGLPITKSDYDNPYSPQGANIDRHTVISNPEDPKDVASVTVSASITEETIASSGISQSQQSYLNTFLLIDSKLQMNNNWSVIPGSSKVSDSWFAIITGANGIPQTQGYTPAVQQAYDAALAVLQNADGTPTAHYVAYQNKQNDYDKKVKAFHKAYADCFTDPNKLQGWPMTGIDYDSDVADALNNCDVFGFKNEIESALATLEAKGTDPSMALINQAKSRFDNSLLEFTNLGKIPYTIMLPNTWYDKDNDDGWNEYTYTDFHSENHYAESDTSFSGDVGISLGFWSMGGGYGSNSQQSSLNIETNNLEISFSYCTVDIERPWLDTTLLNLKGWFLMGDYNANCISDGTMGQQLTVNKVEPLFLPSIVTSLILIKDISIKWDNWQADWTNMQNSVAGGLSVGFGPFAASGSYSHHEERRDFTCDASGEALVIPGIQVIGYISAINPPCPAVDSSNYVNIINH